VYDLRTWRVGVHAEDACELRGGCVVVGQDAAGLGPPAGGRIKQHGLLNAGKAGQELVHGSVQAGVVGLSAHQVRDSQGQHAG